MPELPEVETIRMGLQQYLVGHTIERVEVRLPKMVSGEVQLVHGSKVTGVRRYGKGLVIDLSNNHSIAVHVKMTGQLIYQETASNAAAAKETEGGKISEKVGGALPNRSTHVVFQLDESATLYYNDIRQFGWIKITPTDEVQSLPFFKDLGPEPNVIDYSSSEGSESRSSSSPQGRTILTLDLFKQLLKKAKTAVKPYIMDQKIISGIGNIYANDALFYAGIDPRRPANSLSEQEAESLFNSIEKVLKKGLEVGGSSEWQYVNALGEEGGYQKIFKVYNKKTCSNCGGEITKIKLGGRGTSFCSACQR